MQPIEFDKEKNGANLIKHGMSLETATEFDLDSAITVIDDRKDYGEIRHSSIGYIGKRLHACIWTKRENGMMRVISLRKANRRERKYYNE
ncbi:MAG: BrnT family toxin [Rickettsiales bacterium]